MTWAIYVMLGTQMWEWEKDNGKRISFDDEAWKIIVAEAHKNGLDTIVLDLGEGVRYGSHPELARPGAWSRERVREEVKALKAMGITLIPKMNFSATHHFWLGEYAKMMSTAPYYRVCRDLIYEVYTLFDKPPYIHLGMDEEDEVFCVRNNTGLVSMRRGELFWHDLQFLCDCVRDTGATPWIFADHCLKLPDEFRRHIMPEDILLTPGHYLAVKKEHYTLIEDSPMYKAHYSQEPYVHMKLKYVEDDPYFVRFMQQAVPAARDGYDLMPVLSTYNKCEYNTDDHVEYFRDNAPAERLKGFLTAPWLTTEMENVAEIVRNMELLKAAREKYYG